MSNQLDVLRQLINRRSAPSQGVVAAIQPDGILVSTNAGNRLLRRDDTDATSYSPKDRVYLNGDRIQGRIPDPPERYVL